MQTRTATCAHEPKRLEASQQVRICEDAATFLRHEFHAKAPHHTPVHTIRQLRVGAGTVNLASHLHWLLAGLQTQVSKHMRQIHEGIRTGGAQGPVIADAMCTANTATPPHPDA